MRDYGQGFIPNEVREDGKTILEAAFSVLNTSGKYREDGTYEGTSLGSFGIGSKITTYLSHWLTVSTVRDGMSETINFIVTDASGGKEYGDRDFESGKSATFWFDGTNYYDSDPTESQLSSDATLASISVNGTAISGFASIKFTPADKVILNALSGILAITSDLT